LIGARAGSARACPPFSSSSLFLHHLIPSMQRE